MRVFRAAGRRLLLPPSLSSRPLPQGRVRRTADGETPPGEEGSLWPARQLSLGAALWNDSGSVVPDGAAAAAARPAALS